MSEAQAAFDTASSAGFLLRQAREHAGLHVAALAGALKVPQRQLEALEQDRLDLLPDVVYARALAASVCRNLRLDPQVVLARLPKGEDSRLGKGQPINVPFRASGDVARSATRELLTRPPVMVALALLVGAVVLLLLPLIPNRSAEPPASTAGVAGGPNASATVPGTPSAPTGMVSETVTPAGVLGAPAPVSAVAGTGTTTPSPSPSPATTAAGAADPAAASTTAAGDSPVLAVRATQPAWLQVTDSRGTVHVRRTLTAGESVNISAATPPLAVVVGSANTTQVQVRGKPFELRPVTRDNVARFEVR